VVRWAGRSVLPRVLAMAGGSFHSVAVSDGARWTWGRNSVGQLGDGTNTDSSAAVPVSDGGINWVAVTAGGNDTVALKSDGTVWSWGSNSVGQLGNGTTLGSNVPVQVVTSVGGPALTNVAAVAAGSNHTVALKSDGTLWAWGNGLSGQLGNGTDINSNVPVQEFTKATDWVAVTAGNGHTVALKSDGSLWAWGANNHGQLGNGTNINSNVPMRVPGFGPAIPHDFNGDLKSDILWRNAATGQNAVWLMNGISLLPATGFTTAVPGVDWKVAGTGDFNGDGKSDILWRNAVTGENAVWLMNGTSLLTGTGFTTAVPGVDWKVAGTGDFNGDGKSDILWRNAATGENAVWLMNGTSLLPATGFTTAVPGVDWNVAGTGDFNGDGKSDILWRNTATGENAVWMMNGTSLLPATGFTTAVPGADWNVAGTGDYNGDGKSDILWRNAVTGENAVWLMNGTSLLPGTGFTTAVPGVDWNVQ